MELKDRANIRVICLSLVSVVLGAIILVASFVIPALFSLRDIVFFAGSAVIGFGAYRTIVELKPNYAADDSDNQEVLQF
jgi:hypothetical protein